MTRRLAFRALEWPLFGIAIALHLLGTAIGFFGVFFGSLLVEAGDAVERAAARMRR